MKKLVKHSLYLVEWIDAYAYNGWYKEEEIDERTKTGSEKTIGFLVKTTDTFIILAMSLASNPDLAPYGMVKWIPKKCVLKIKKINEKL